MSDLSDGVGSRAAIRCATRKPWSATRNPIGRALSIGLLCASLPLVSVAQTNKLGFVVESWYTAIYDTEYMEECPEGIAIGSDEIWFNGLSPEEKELWTTGGTQQVLDAPRRPTSYLRGPNGEDVCWHPESVVEPPMRIVHGKYAFGMNLDGETEGQATANTCAHGNFVTPDGRIKGVDNQLYRLMGCVYGYRSEGYLEHHANRERQDESKGIILIDVSNVDDPYNDDSVEVAFYLSATDLRFDSSGRIVPYGSYQTVPGRYGDRVSGRIVDGVIRTDPGDVTLPIYGNDGFTDMVFKDFRIEIEIAADATRAKGLWAGYHPVDSFWDHIVKVQHNVPVGQYSCPALYVAAHELADGYPDPETGDCTALSSAFTFEAVAGFVVDSAEAARDAERLAKNMAGLRTSEPGDADAPER
jgi:hypothetical protein